MEVTDIQLPRSIKLLLHIVKGVNFVIDTIFRIPLLLSVFVIGFLMGLPVVGVWCLFILYFSLPPPIRAVFFWGILLFIITLAGAVDYLRSTMSG